MYYMKKVKRKCDIRGCRNTDCYAISKSREAGNSIIVCKECLKGSFAAIEKFEKNTPATKKMGSSEPPPLFFLGDTVNYESNEELKEMEKVTGKSLETGKLEIKKGKAPKKKDDKDAK